MHECAKPPTDNRTQALAFGTFPALVFCSACELPLSSHCNRGCVRRSDSRAVGQSGNRALQGTATLLSQGTVAIAARPHPSSSARASTVRAATADSPFSIFLLRVWHRAATALAPHAQPSVPPSPIAFALRGPSVRVEFGHAVNTAMHMRWDEGQMAC